MHACLLDLFLFSKLRYESIWISCTVGYRVKMKMAMGVRCRHRRGRAWRREGRRGSGVLSPVVRGECNLRSEWVLISRRSCGVFTCMVVLLLIKEGGKVAWLPGESAWI